MTANSTWASHAKNLESFAPAITRQPCQKMAKAEEEKYNREAEILAYYANQSGQEAEQIANNERQATSGQKQKEGACDEAPGIPESSQTAPLYFKEY